MDETHVEHSVGFVEHEHFDAAQIDVALLHQVEQTARSGNDDVDSAAEVIDLRVLVDAAEDDGLAKVEELAVGAEVIRDLRGEFARGAEDEATGFGALTLACGL